jgi:hypothetical protein
VRAVITMGMKRPHEGARASVRCAIDASLANGSCFADGGAFEPSALSRDAALGRRLWDASAAWVGLPP